MQRIWLIGWKDLTIMFRDRAALLFMLAAPFALTLGLGFVSGRFSAQSGSGLSDIPVVIVNEDDGPLGATLADVLAAEDLADLLEPQAAADADRARQLVDEDQVAAAVLIPAGFSDSFLRDPTTGALGAAQPIEVYVNPSRPVSAGVAQSIVDEFVARVEAGQVAAAVVGRQLVSSGRLPPEQVARIAQAAGINLAEGQGAGESVAVRRSDASPQAADEFDVLAYIAPGMALMFLMYTVSRGGSSVLTEQLEGTLPRLLSTPTHLAQVLGGKVLGIFLTGFAQVSILVVGSSLLFGLRWGNPLGVLLLIAAAVVGATGWGTLLTAVAKTPNQVANLGTMLMLVFGMLGGSFVALSAFPAWMRAFSWITPNGWGLTGFTALASGGTWMDVLEPVGALLLMGAVLFTVSLGVFRRFGLARA